MFFLRRLSFTFIILLSLTPLAHAQTNRFSVMNNYPALGNDGLFFLPGTELIEKNQWAFHTFADYSYRPLELSAAGVRVQGVIDQLLVQYFGAAYAPTDYWQLDVELPVVWINQFTTPVVPSTSSNKIGVGDIMVRSHFSLLKRDESNGWGLSLTPYLTLPTGNENHYIADARPRGGATLTADVDISQKLYAILNLGFETRERVIFNDLNRRERLKFGGGLAFAASEYFRIQAEIVGWTAFTEPFQDEINTAVEALGGLHVSFKNSNVALDVGGGTAIIRGAEEPVFRSFAGFSYTPKKQNELLSSAEKQELTTSVHFGKNSADLSSSGLMATTRLASVLKKHRRASVRVTATDFPEEKNWALLREQRVIAITDVLKQNGVKNSQIQILFTNGGQDVSSRNSVQLQPL